MDGKVKPLLPLKTKLYLLLIIIPFGARENFSLAYAGTWTVVIFYPPLDLLGIYLS